MCFVEANAPPIDADERRGYNAISLAFAKIGCASSRRGCSSDEWVLSAVAEIGHDCWKGGQNDISICQRCWMYEAAIHFAVGEGIIAQFLDSGVDENLSKRCFSGMALDFAAPLIQYCWRRYSGGVQYNTIK